MQPEGAALVDLWRLNLLGEIERLGDRGELGFSSGCCQAVFERCRGFFPCPSMSSRRKLDRSLA